MVDGAGNSKTSLIIACSGSSYNVTETLSTLRFGTRAKSIRNKPRVNQVGHGSMRAGEADGGPSRTGRRRAEEQVLHVTTKAEPGRLRRW